MQKQQKILYGNKLQAVLKINSLSSQQQVEKDPTQA